MSEQPVRRIGEQEIAYARNQWISRTMDVHRLCMTYGEHRTVEQELTLAKACVARDRAGERFETVGALWDAQRAQDRARQQARTKEIPT